MRKTIKYYILLSSIAILLTISIIGALLGNILLSVVCGIFTVLLGLLFIVVYIIDKSFSFFDKEDNFNNHFWNK